LPHPRIELRLIEAMAFLDRFGAGERLFGGRAHYRHR
jgi:hypothetical protein